MKFLKWIREFLKRIREILASEDFTPEPKFGETGLAIIADPKTARYLLIEKRWWDRREEEWMYEGAELIIKSDILTVVARDQLYAESDLIPVRGL